MTIKISFEIIPFVFTIFFLIMMLRPYRSGGVFDFGSIFRVFWVVPVLIVWLIYFVILAYIK